MISVLSAAASREADDATSNTFGIPGFTLMETAGRSAATLLMKQTDPELDRILCCCGTGNNGGDGLVVARVLAAAGYAVDVVLVGREDRESESNHKNRELFEVVINSGSLSRTCTINRIDNEGAISRSQATWIVDGLLGTGVRGSLREPIASCVTTINDHSASVLSLDLPTGLDADTGKASGQAIRADMTVSFAALKPGIVMNSGPELCGAVHVTEIGIPQHIIAQVNSNENCGERPQAPDIRKWLPNRSTNAHKYSSGALLVVAGSRGLTGAPVLASSAGLRVGAGAVFLATGADVLPTVEQKVVEIMTVGLPTDLNGIREDVATDSLAATIARSNALVIGCGLGRESGTVSFIRKTLSETTVPTVVDADALFAISEDEQFIRAHSNGLWILTPHRGEFERLIGAKVDWDQRATLAARYAREWNCVLILKGNPTVIGLPDRPTIFNPTGNESLATAGTGDVLAGMIGGYLAQGLSPMEAAIVGSFVGGKTADTFIEEFRTTTMIASDVIDRVPGVVAEIIRTT